MTDVLANRVKSIFNNNIIDKQTRLDRLKQEASKIRCFYCLDYQRVYINRKNGLAWMDGQGSFDIIYCKCCTDKGDQWIKCTNNPDSEWPGICFRGGGSMKPQDIADDITKRLINKI